MCPLKICLKFSTSISSQGQFFLSFLLTHSPCFSKSPLVETKNFLLLSLQIIGFECLVLFSIFPISDVCQTVLLKFLVCRHLSEKDHFSSFLPFSLDPCLNRWKLWEAINVIVGTRGRWCGYVSLVIGLGFVKMVYMCWKSSICSHQTLLGMSLCYSRNCGNWRGQHLHGALCFWHRHSS